MLERSACELSPHLESADHGRLGREAVGLDLGGMLTCGVRIGVGAHPNHRSALLRQCRRRPQREREDGEKKREEDRRTGRRSAREDRQAAPRLGSCREMSRQVGTSLCLTEWRRPRRRRVLAGWSATQRRPIEAKPLTSDRTGQGERGLRRATKASTSRRVTCVKCEQGQLDVLLRHPPRSISATECRFPCKAEPLLSSKAAVAYSDTRRLRGPRSWI